MEQQRPEPFSATLGTREDGVLLEWGAVAGAVGYRVTRDDLPIAVVEAEVRTYLDTDAPVAPLPAAPQGVTATRDAATVTVAWQAVPAPEAPTSDYRVVPLFEDRDGLASVRRLGRRGSSPIRYEVRVEGQSAWQAVGDGLTWEDDTLGPGTVTIGPPRVGRGSDREGVPLDIEWLRFSPGPERTWTVRAVNAAGASEPSEPATGRRMLAESDLVFAWERVSAPGQAQPVRPAALASREALDRDAPADGARAVYRLIVTEPDGFSQASLSAPGYRGWGDCIDRSTFRGQPRALATGDAPDFSAGIDSLLFRVEGLGLADGETAVLQPPVQITGGLVTAIERFADGRFRVADADAVVRVQLEEGHRLSPDDEVEVGQRLTFAVTHVSMSSGHLLVRRVSGLQRVGEDHPVQVLLASGEPLHPDDVDLVVRIAGQVVEEVGPCGARYTCYTLRHGPRGGTDTIVFRSDRDDVGVGTCITWTGPLSQFPGPWSDAPTPGTLQLDGLDWAWYWRSPPGEE